MSQAPVVRTPPESTTQYSAFDKAMKILVSYFLISIMLLSHLLLDRIFKLSNERLKSYKLYRQFLNFVEKMTVWCSVPIHDKPIVKEVEELSTDLLAELVNDQVAAVRVKGFLNENENQEFLSKIKGFERQNSLIANGMPTDTDNIGYPEQVIKIIDEYQGKDKLEAALSKNMELKKKIGNGKYFSPIAKLVWKLNELYPSGARKGMSIYSKRYKWYQNLGYIIRVYHKKSETDFKSQAARKFTGFIHRDAPSAAERKTANISGFAANIYHSVPQGGELYIWTTLSRTWFQKVCNLLVDRLSQDNIYEFVQECCPSPAIIKPEKGDLILLNFSYMHAVKPVEEGERITSQSLVYVTERGLVY